MFLLHAMTSFSADATTCKRPGKDQMNDIKAKFSRMKSTYLTDSFNILYINNRKTDEDINQTFVSKRSLKIGWMNTNCPKELFHNPCPHYYVLEVDKNRIPQVFLQAKCKCTKCSLSDKDNGIEIGLRCMKIYHYSTVMRATKCSQDGKMIFEEVLERVSIGCACRRGVYKRSLMKN